MNYCLECGSENKISAAKCHKCGTAFGAFKLINLNKVVKPTVKKLTEEKFDDLSNQNIEFDFSSLAGELEEQLSLKSNKSVPSHKKIKWEDLFSQGK